MDLGIFPYEIEAWGVNSNTYFQILNILKVTGVYITKKKKKNHFDKRKVYFIILLYHFTISYLLDFLSFNFIHYIHIFFF